MKKVKTKSGIYGWRDRVQGVYSSMEELKAYDETYGICERLGMPLNALWELNPIIEGSTNPDDLRIVSKGYHIRKILAI
jgi:hypothetical protein